MKKNLEINRSDDYKSLIIKDRGEGIVIFRTDNQQKYSFDSMSIPETTYNLDILIENGGNFASRLHEENPYYFDNLIKNKLPTGFNINEYMRFSGWKMFIRGYIERGFDYSLIGYLKERLRELSLTEFSYC